MKFWIGLGLSGLILAVFVSMFRSGGGDSFSEPRRDVGSELSQSFGNKPRKEGGARLPEILRKHQPSMETVPQGEKETVSVGEEFMEVDRRLDQLLALLQRGDFEQSEVTDVFLSSLKEFSGDERREFLSKAGTLLAIEGPELLWDILPNLTMARERQVLIGSAIDVMLAKNPAEAAGWVDGLSEGGGRGTASELLARRWAQQDLDGARAWVGGLPPGSSDAVKATEGLVWSWMQEDPSAVVEYAQTLEDPIVQGRAFEKAAKILAVEDPAAAAAWAAEFPQDEQRRELVDYSLYRWAKEDPEAARAWVEAAEDNEVQVGASHALVRAWADTDPAGATQWVMDHRNDLDGDLPLLNASRQWADQDPVSAAAWLADLDDPMTQGRVMDNITRVIANRGGEALDEWIREIHDPALRARANQVIEQVAAPPALLTGPGQ
jgi:hypothetical protein